MKYLIYTLCLSVLFIFTSASAQGATGWYIDKSVPTVHPINAPDISIVFMHTVDDNYNFFIRWPVSKEACSSSDRIFKGKPIKVDGTWVQTSLYCDAESNTAHLMPTTKEGKGVLTVAFTINTSSSVFIRLDDESILEVPTANFENILFGWLADEVVKDIKAKETAI
jgi:hypothetical protein